MCDFFGDKPRTDGGLFGLIFGEGNLTLSRAWAIFTPRLRIGRKTL
jgi:hypothetical protein